MRVVGFNYHLDKRSVSALLEDMQPSARRGTVRYSFALLPRPSYLLLLARPMRVGFDGTPFPLPVAAIAGVHDMAKPDCTQCRVPAFPLPQPMRRVVRSDSVFKAMRELRDNGQVEDMTAWHHVRNLARRELTNPDQVESILLDILECGCTIPDSACTTLEQGR